MVSTVDHAIEKLKETAIEEIKFQWGFHDEMVHLKDRLARMQVALRDTDEKSLYNASGISVEKPKETLFKIEDALEEFQLKMELTKSDNGGNIMSCVTNIFGFLKQRILTFLFHQKLRTINEELDILEEKSKHLDDNNQKGKEEEDTSHRGLSSPYLEDSEVLGIHERVSKLIKLVEESKEHMHVITVWGPGGSGKTTLVKQLYKNILGKRKQSNILGKSNQSNNKLYCFAWAYVGPTSNVEGILKEMVKGFQNSAGDQVLRNISEMNFHELQAFLLDYLQNKTYILILDDVWDPDVLSRIEVTLPKSYRCSSIIITTRDQTVTSRSRFGGKHHIYRVEQLDSKLSLELFCKLAFRYYPEGRCAEDLNDVARKLANRCQGLPLAITAVARLMANKSDDVREWNEVLNNLGLELEENLKEVNQVLMLSYKHLPKHLKYCFLYCAMFPKGHLLSIKKLARLWSAEGFVQEKNRKAREDVAGDYVQQLCNRSMLQYIIHPISREPKFCQVPHLLHDFMVPVLANENFGVIFPEQITCDRLQARHRRLSLHEPPPRHACFHSKWKPRSLILCCSIPDNPFLHKILENIQLLGVLDLDGVQLQSLPPEMGNLIHLRYLGLRRTSIYKLPESFAKLCSLQTLDVRDTKIDSLPKWVTELENLRHLFAISNSSSKSYVKLGCAAAFKSTKLQTLSGVAVNLFQAAVLLGRAEMTQLRKLKLSVHFDNSYNLHEDILNYFEVRASVRNMTKLRSLTLHTVPILVDLPTGERTPLDYLKKLVLVAIRLTAMPSFLNQHNLLEEIRLFSCSLGVDLFRVLGELPKLAILILENSKWGEELTYGQSSFPNLKYLRIVKANDLKVWNHASGSMKMLDTLTIAQCPNLQNVTDILQHLESLQKCEMDEELLAKMAVDGTENDEAGRFRKWDGKTLHHVS